MVTYIRVQYVELVYTQINMPVSLPCVKSLGGKKNLQFSCIFIFKLLSLH